MPKLPLKWDGTDVGEISSVVRGLDEYTFTLIDNSRVGVSSHNMDYIVIDELKPVFGIDKIGRHSCTYNGNKCIIHRILKDSYISDFGSIDSYLINEIRDAYTCRWMLGVKQSYHNTVIIRTYKSGVSRAIPFSEKGVDYTTDSHWGSKLPKNIVDKWFGNESDITMEESRFRLVSRYNMTEFRKAITKVVDRVHPNYTPWITSICSRVYPYLKS